MSMNLHLSGERTVTVNKTGKESKQTTHFNLWQTPTIVTREALKPGVNTKQEYLKWAKSISRDEVEEIFAPEDIWVEHPIGTRIVNPFEEHSKELEEWIKECKEEGYDIEWYEL